MIGILGGMGPAAGIELARILTEETEARNDQDHLPFVLLSVPNIPDRSGYLLGQQPHNPAKVISQLILKFEACGVTEVGVACNTCHAPSIYDQLVQLGRTRGISFHHIIRSTAEEIASLKTIRQVGVMGTKGCLKLGLYQKELERVGLQAIAPDEYTVAPLIHQAIYDPVWGIKANPYKIGGEPLVILEHVARELGRKGAEAIILGCTELPLAVKSQTLSQISVIDPLRSLARSLIRSVAPHKLKQSENSSSNNDRTSGNTADQSGLVKIPSLTASASSLSAQPQE